GQEKYTTEVVLQGFNSVLTMLDRAGGGGATEVGEESSGDFGSFAPARERKPALVGAGADKRGDLDDDIPF
ncbi:MAG TPA: single-stranded DNA-binding protein, partial [Xanthobacteraceae bacterium]